MMKSTFKTIAILLISLLISIDLYAVSDKDENTLVDFLESYQETKGVDYVNLKGFMLNFAKPALKKTPMKNVVDEIDNVCVFNMSGAGKDIMKSFDKKLASILAGYEKVAENKEGKTESTIYLIRKDDAYISEIVVYSGNEDIAIVVMKGDIPVSLLEEMADQEK